MEDGGPEPPEPPSFGAHLLKGKLGETINEVIVASPSEILKNTLTLVKKHNMNHTEHVNILKLINSIFRSAVVPDTSYLVDKLYMTSSDYNIYFFCYNCKVLLPNVNTEDGEDEEDNSSDEEGNETTEETIPEGSVKCRKCKSINVVDDLTKAHFFVIWDLVPKIQLLFKDPEIAEQLIDVRDFISAVSKEKFKDLHDAEVYRKYANSLHIEAGVIYFSAVMCVDGSPLYKSSSHEIWPMFFELLELPPLVRMGNLLLGGLWFGKDKPNFDLFFDPMVKKLHRLSEVGAKIQILNEEKLCKLHMIGVCVDSGARGSVQGIHTFSGEAGCNFCLHVGEIEAEGTSVRKYDYLEEPAPLRTQAQMERDAAEVVRMRPTTPRARKPHINGVIKASPLLAVPHLHIVDGQVADYLHAACLGVCRQMLKIWLESTDRVLQEDGRPPDYYIGSPLNLEAMNAKFKLLCPPVEVRKCVRDFDDVENWKGRELENFILYYSLPVLYGTLPDRHVRHWGLFVDSMHLLLKSEVTVEDIREADIKLNELCRDLKGLYPYPGIPLKHMTFNVHLLLHFAANCLRWGPMWCVCSYSFEKGNGSLKNALHAERGIANQILRRLGQDESYSFLTHNIRTPRSENLTKEVQNNKAKNCMYANDATLFGRKGSFLPNEEEMWLLREADLQDKSLSHFTKMVIDKCCYTSSSHRKPDAAHNNSFFTLKNSSEYMLLKKIIYCQETRNVFVLASKVHTEDWAFSKTMKIIEVVEDEVHLFPSAALKTVCFQSEVDDNAFITEVPNVMNVF